MNFVNSASVVSCGSITDRDEIALTIADRLKLTLLSDEKARLVKHSTENLEAYNLYSLGRYFFYNASAEEDYKKAIRYSEQALAKDPGYALAYALQAGQMIFIKVVPWLENLRSDPRYKKLLKKLVLRNNPLRGKDEMKYCKNRGIF